MCFTHPHCPGKKCPVLLSAAAAALRLGQNVTLLIPILYILWGGCGCDKSIPRISFKKLVTKSLVTGFKQVPGTGGKWNDSPGRLDRRTSAPGLSLFPLPLFLPLSWNAAPTEPAMLAEWKVCGIPKQIPSNSLQSLNKRQLQPLFPAKCQS